MTIIEYEDYKKFLNNHIKTLPKHGHGQFRKLALFLNVNSVTITQVLRGDKDFSVEQALPVAKFFGLTGLQSEALLLLISRDRAGTSELKQHYTQQLNDLRKQARLIKKQVATYKELTDEDKAQFYSNWYYSGIRLISSVPGYQTVNEIAKHFELSASLVANVLEFLTQRGLCTFKDNKYQMGVTSTHLDSSSKYINNHRRNWRLKAFERFTEPKPDELFYSGPYSLSHKDVLTIRNEIVQFIGSISKRVEKSDSETLSCLNIDWFQPTK